MTKQKLSFRLKAGVCILVALTMCLCVTSFALVYSTLSVENNLFETGKISIDLNGGAPIVEGDEFHLYPGATFEKTFYLQNNSTDSVYYRLFFEGVDGDLASLVQITILHESKVLYHGTATALTKKNVTAADDVLSIGKKRILTVLFYLPEETDNTKQNGYLSFDLCAEAVQSKHNPDRKFD